MLLAESNKNMKAIFITYNQAYYDEIAQVLSENGTKGYTEWNEIKGRGSNTGEPHLGSHAWPTLNNAMLTFVEDKYADDILEQLHKKDLVTPELGLRAFCWSIEKSI